MLDALEKLAMEATPGPWEAYTDCPGECCWLIRKPEPDRQEWESMNEANGITWPETSREDAAYIAAADPATVLKMIAALRAAKQYYEHYCQDEADDGEYAREGMPGHNTGCMYAQAIDALALRSALAALEKPDA